MGWLFKAGISRRDLIAENTKGWERTKEDGTVIKSACLAHCYRGGVFSGVLWSVWKRTFIKDGKKLEQPQRWIICDLLRYVDGEWGFKDMSESVHPFFYSCPRATSNSFPSNASVGNAEWRDLVRQYHARGTAKRRAKKAARQVW